MRLHQSAREGDVYNADTQVSVIAKMYMCLDNTRSEKVADV